MKFSLVRVDNPNKLKSLSKNKTSFFKREEEISLFHFNMFDNGLFHAVFSISDEYQVSTKKLGSQHNFVYSSLVNFFFLNNHNYAFLEYVNNEYQNEVVKEIDHRTKNNLETQLLDNSLMIKLYKELSGTIKKIRYSNDEGELFDLDFVNHEGLIKIGNQNTIDDFTVLVENQYISVSREGFISVDNSDELFLIGFTKRILDAIY